MKFTAAALSTALLAPVVLAQSSASSAASAASSAVASGSSSAASPSGSMSVTTGNGDAAYVTSLLGALSAAGLSTLVQVASTVATVPEGQTLLGELARGNKTVFAPTNEAFESVSDSVTGNATLLAQILSYHILNNTYSGAGIATTPNHTIARTLLRGGEFRLPGNRTAPLVLERPSSASNSSMSSNSTMSNSTMSGNSTEFRIVQANLTTPMGPMDALNLQIYTIDTVLTLPASIPEALQMNAPTLAGLANSTGLLMPLEEAVGITIFAPTDSALGQIQSSLGSLNMSQIMNILENHVINGTAVYSNELTSSNYTSAAGEPFKFSRNSTGTYVTSANSTAEIVTPDIIIENGVIHLINGVLVNTNNNSQAAESAYQSNTKVAATQTDQTGAITGTSQPAASGSKGSGGTGGAARLSGSMVAGAAGILAAVIGGAFVLI